MKVIALKRLWPSVLRGWQRVPHTVQDGVLVAVILLVALAEVAEHVEMLDLSRSVQAALLVFVILEVVPLLARRVFPVAVVLVTVAVVGVHALVPDVPLSNAQGYGVTVAVYTVASRGPRRRSGLCALAAATMFLVAGALSGRPEIPELVTAGPLVVAAAWWVGDSSLARRAYALAQGERAALVASEQEATARAAIAEERARIARDLHDELGHDLNALVLRAAAARVGSGDSDEQRQALRDVEECGRRAMDEVDRILGFLRQRTEPSVWSAQPGLADVTGLVERTRKAGLTVRLSMTDEPVSLGRAVGTTGYRIVQEALTNALKYSAGGEADVRIGYGPGDLDIVVHSRGGGRATPGGGLRGNGLAGMRDRVEDLGGTLEAGFAQGDGFRVRATLPCSKMAMEPANS